MRVLTLASQHAPVLADALVRRGWEPGRAEAAAHGVRTVAFLFDGVSDEIREGIAAASRTHGIECLTGDGWVLIVGGLSRVAGLARPGFGALPDQLAEPLGSRLRHLSERPATWHTARGPIPLDQPRVMGILNVTPDSFSDGGLYLHPDAAIDHAEVMLSAGADIIDVGAESTRPGADDRVPPVEEWRRLQPVLEGLARRFPEVKVSVDTVKSETARRALELGAAIVNDVSGFRLDPQMRDVCAEGGAGVILMHSRGDVHTMASYEHADYADVMTEISDELLNRCDEARTAGLPAEAIVVDPGLGFSKRPADNYAVLRRLSTLAALGHPIMVGPSRKRFLRQIVNDGLDLADDMTAAVCVSAYQEGAMLFRVHDVGKTRAALRVAAAVRGE